MLAAAASAAAAFLAAAVVHIDQGQPACPSPSVDQEGEAFPCGACSTSVVEENPVAACDPSAAVRLAEGDTPCQGLRVVASFHWVQSVHQDHPIAVASLRILEFPLKA